MSLSGHSTPIECVRFGHSEELVCAGSASGALKIWDLEAARLVRSLTGHKAGIRSIDLHPYGDFLSSGSVDTNLKLWDIRRKGCIFTYKGHSGTVTCLKFSPDGQWVASGKFLIFITISTFTSVRPSGGGGGVGIPLSIFKFLQSFHKVSQMKVA